MDFRLAVMRDLAQLKAMYRQIVQNMNAQGIQIWDEIYRFLCYTGSIDPREVLIRHG